MPRSVKRLAVDQFDRKLSALQKAANEIRKATPQTGWLNGLRTLLGMSNRAVAQRLRISHPTLLKLERSEQLGTITLASLRKAADALDAELVYAIVPRRGLRETISARARAVALDRVAPVAQSMAMEGQRLSAQQINRQVGELARELEERPRDLWR